MKFPADRVTLLDGSMGQELINRGVSGHGLLWSAGALLASPRSVRDIHDDYIAAGADIITTNTYSATRMVLSQAGLEHRFTELNHLAGKLAGTARDQADRRVLIAGSLPPYRESYRPDLVEPFEVLEPLYREQAELLGPYVDFFLCETMSAISEAVAAATGASRAGKPLWVSFTLADEGDPVLRSGETIEEAVRALDGLGVERILLNCCLPEAISRGLPLLAETAGVPVGAYGNAFVPIPEKWEHLEDEDLPPARTDLDVERYAGFCSEWMASGATVIGGCCEIGPAHIARLRALIDGRAGPA